MSDDASADEVRVVVRMRDLSPPPDDPRTRVLSRLRAFEAEGVVDEVSVRGWGKCVPAPDGAPDEPSSPIRERIADFQRWADRNGHSLEPAFRRHERSSMVSEESHDVVRLPLQCLAVYEGDRLAGVFPCSADGETNTVGDCVQRLETGAVPGDPNTE